MSKHFHYDAVRYPSNVFAHFRPDHTGAMAALHGVKPTRTADCRTLELGCGDGASLLSIAYSMPQSHCVGIDLSEKRIAEANAHAKAIGLSNIEFHHMDLMEFDMARFGKFDFMIAHGLFSWVPPFVRDRLLSIYKECLSPTGVGYISYNAYPGWYMGQILRDAGRFILGDESVTLEHADRAFEFLQLAAATAKPGSVYEAVVKGELEKIAEKNREIFMHDELSDFNQPFYITDFISLIESVGLAYVAEADPIMQFTAKLDPKTSSVLDAYLDTPARREQCLDFLRGTRFRSTLICHAEAKPKYLPDDSALDDLYFTTDSLATTAGASLLDDSAVEFSTRSGSAFSTNFPLTKTFLGHLGDRLPHRVPFADAVARLRDNFGHSEYFEEKLTIFRQHVTGLYHAEIVDGTYYEPDVADSVSERPKASAFARWQMAIGFPFATTPGGRNIQIEGDMPRWLLQQMDGDQALSSLVGPLRSALAGQTASDADLHNIVTGCAERFCKLGFLVS